MSGNGLQRVKITEGIHLLDTHEVAKITGMSEDTLRRWRVQGGGPPFVKVRGWAVRYHPEHVEAWASRQLCVHLSARGGQEKAHAL